MLSRKLLAELIGTFLVTAAAMSVDILYYSAAGVDYTSRWLARGFMTAVVIYTFSEISGAHVNPAVTLGFTLRGVFSSAMMLWYWLAQFAGSFGAALLLEALFGRSLIYFGASRPGPHFSHVVAALCEVVLTFAVMLTILILAREKAQVGKQSALAVGLAVAACGFIAGPISGASMNPSRSIAPQILSGAYDLVWIYAVGPAVGAAIAVGVHAILSGKPTRSEREGARGG